MKEEAGPVGKQKLDAAEPRRMNIESFEGPTRNMTRTTASQSRTGAETKEDQAADAAS